MNKLPLEFVSQMQQQLSEEAKCFLKALEIPPPTSIRLNPKKPLKDFNFEIGESVLWESHGHYLPQRPIFTLDPAFHAGAYYVQEASSMFLGFVIQQLKTQKGAIKVLDLCAAPGGKSTHIASYLDYEDLLVSNETIKSRVGILKENMLKWGFPNVIVSNQDPETFTGLEGFFDIVVVDAPCSGEGLFRKASQAACEWSTEHVNMCASRQKRILSAASLLVTQNGHLIYSTCTYNQKENRENVEWLEQTFEFTARPLETPPNWKIQQYKNQYQFLPHLTQGEGFFLSISKKYGHTSSLQKNRLPLNRLPKDLHPEIYKWLDPKFAENIELFRKNDGGIIAIPQNLVKPIGQILSNLTKRSSGFEIGIFKGHDFLPSHSLALSTAMYPDTPKLKLEKDAALRFLKKESIEFDNEISNGWYLVTYQELALGWIKKSALRINNYLPTDLRIRMNIETAS